MSNQVPATSAPHTPVMLDEVLECIKPTANKTIVDATFGAGGYSEKFLASGANVIAFDRDATTYIFAKKLKQQYGEKFQFISCKFSQAKKYLSEGQADGLVFDLGISSMQIDSAKRGFSFQQNGPLDMRMENNGISAAQVLNNIGQKDLTRIIGILGEEKNASAISSAIVAGRPFTTTGELASAIEKATNKKQKIHGATRTFQALRIFINDELNELAKALTFSQFILKPHGCLCVVSFHSLEDKIVKKFFKHTAEQPSVSRHLPPVQKKVLTFMTTKRGITSASENEVKKNVRARSAKLRFAFRLPTANQPIDMAIFNLPNLIDIKRAAACG